MKKQAQIFHFDLFGKREDKYDFLNENSISSIRWTELKPKDPNFFFVNKNFEGQKEYEKGFKVDELFSVNASGIKTQRDDASIKFTQEECDEIKNDFLTLTNEQLISKYGFKDVRDWTIDGARKDLQTNKVIANKICYRPFDLRFMNYTGKTKGVQGYPRLEVMKHFLEKENLGLITCRQQSTFDFQHVFITKIISDMCSVSSQTKETGYVFPLYLYSEAFGKEERTPNLNMEIIKQIEESLDLQFVAEVPSNLEGPEGEVFSPIDILDYIYAVLHSPTYREKYKEFLKIDFPRVPYPKNKETFWKLVALGKQIREIHLLESPVVENYITQYPIDGNNVVDKIKFELTTEIVEGDTVIHIDMFYEDAFGKVYINDTQYFDNVPLVVWEFYIGGYQPAQKWLKDRKGRTLDFEDILHYQKIIVALKETDRLMKEIDKAGI